MPSLSLPKGGGAIRGIGEKFAVDAATGSGSMSVPIAASTGRSGFGPQLSVSYSSGSGNGPFGFGWTLSLPAISRKTDKGLPRYRDAQDSDVFILSGSEDLVPILTEDASGRWQQDSRPGRNVNGVRYQIRRYRPRIEGLFAIIERWSNTADACDVFWRTVSKDNVTTWYGRTPEARVFDPADPSRIFSWLICETHDDKGNVSVFGYKPEDSAGIGGGAHERNRTPASRSAQRYLKAIRYGHREPYFPVLRSDAPWPVPPDASAPDAGNSWLFELVLDYGEHDAEAPVPAETGAWPARIDPFSSYRAGFEVRTYRTCRRILMFHHFPLELGVGRDCLVRSTDFTYSDRSYTFLRSVSHTGYRAGQSRSLPPVEFQYTEPVVQNTVELIDPSSLDNLPIGLDASAYRWTDLHGEGVSGILTEQAGAWFYKRNLSPLPVCTHDGREHVTAQFAPTETVPRKPGAMLTRGAELMDLDGDGRPDVVVLNGPAPGLYEHDAADSWRPFRPFTSRPNFDTDDPNVKFIDIDGDGLADVLITEDDALVWHQSLAEDGFGPAQRVAQALNEEVGPRVVFADGTQSIYLTDFSGDGLTDLVRIRNGEVCYWPNLGYGRFGGKVTMDNAPWFDNPDQFDQKRIRLADIDGSGTTDIIYLRHDGVQLYFNQSGNSWSKPQQLAGFPRIDDLAAVVPIDLFGNGTICLVWSSPAPSDARRQMRYVDLMGGIKPHLLVKTLNNMGGETNVGYAPSTKFALLDRRDGRPWITRLPFPVHVVERVETLDTLSRTRLVTRYRYHHGYFDGAEREFRGFGMVEQLDTESTEISLVDGVDIGLPPVRTKTWYHTGAVVPGKTALAQLRDEYYAGDPASERLPDLALPAELTPDEVREAHRALKGKVLRREDYADDGSVAAGDPYSVTEYSYRERVVQPRGDNQHAVFWVCGCQTLSYHYERHPADPRISHELTLEADEFGNVLKSAAVTYPRRVADPSLSPAERAVQDRLFLTYTENRVANRPEEPDWYRIGVPVETRTYELTGLGPPDGLFENSGLLAAATGATAIDYEQSPALRAVQKRLIEQVRTVYLSDDLAGPLPLGRIGSHALVHETLKLTLTPGLVAELYEGRVTDEILVGDGYVHAADDPNWWIPSGRAVYAPGAAAHFFLPTGYADPFGKVSRARYDAYDLLLVETVDPLGNRTTVESRDAADNPVRVENDYRVLQPRLVDDPNGNRSAVAFDCLGRVVGTALMGKPGADEGDSLEGFEPDLDDARIDAHLADPLTDPGAALGRATTRVIYNLDRYRHAAPSTPRPATIYSLARETHAADLTPGESTRFQHGFTYFDGLGREILKKAQAEPGPAPRRDAGGVLRCDQNLQPVDPRWVGTGRTVYDNKGHPIRQYQPFFSATHEFEDEKELVECGAATTLCYDPLGRLIRSDEPDGTFSRTEFDPWRTVSYDESDTVLESRWYADRGSPDPAAAEPSEAEARAAWLAAQHADTPAIVHFDTLGRHFLTIDDNGPAGRYRTRRELDIEGNQHAVIDTRGRTVIRRQFDMLGSTLLIDSAESGRTLVALDAGGKTAYSWDSRGHRIRLTYDELRRPARVYIRPDAEPEQLAERTIYGEAHPDAVARNLRTRYYQHYDGAGLVTNGHNDFKGNALETMRRLAKEYRQTPDWMPIDGLDDATLVASAPATLLEDETFTLTTSFDALSRPTAITTPDASVVRPAYNEAGLLEHIDVRLHGDPRWTTVLQDIEYNARGQRTLLRHGNDARTEYVYDPRNFRLIRLRTTRPTPADRRVLQDLTYTYDPAGNITSIHDEAQQAVFFDNRVVPASSRFTYDALYRLISATGREHIGQVDEAGTRWDDAARCRRQHPHDGQAMRRYAETYRFDDVGNLLELVHRANGGNARRTFTYDERSSLDEAVANNRLSRSSVRGAVESFAYDAHGNLTSMPHLARLGWDTRDRLQYVDRQGGGSAWYAYDANNIRVRKVLERQNGTRRAERIYLGSFEIYREYDGRGETVTLARETLHVTDDKKLVALVETRTRGSDLGAAQLIRYQFHDHLGTATLELDDHAQVISYEEFYPFGGTAYQAVRSRLEAPKRYRYAGKERDEETGLYYFGARYYAPWLCRWTTVDPAGLADGVNVYPYARNNPVRLTDPNGALSWGQWAGIGAAIVVGTVVTVATAGLAGPIVGTAAAAIIGGIVGGAAGSAIGEVAEAAVDHRPITAANVGKAALIGGITGGVFAGAGVAASAIGRSAFGQAVASRVSSSAAAQVVRSTTTRIAASAVGQATRRAASRVASSAVGNAVRRIGGRAVAGLQGIQDAAERAGMAIGRGIPGTPAARALAQEQAAVAAGERLDQIVRTGGPLPPETRGVGAAVIDVPGYAGSTELRALSGRATDALVAGAPVEHALEPAVRNLPRVTGIRGSSEGAISHINDVEIKLLEHIGDRLPPNATGTVYLTSVRTRASGAVLEELPACSACTFNLFTFQADNPGIKLVSMAASSQVPTLALPVLEFSLGGPGGGAAARLLVGQNR
jgi:RHS repeat-associated protein